MPLEELWRHRAPRTCPADFEDFWNQTIESARQAAQPADLRREASPVSTVLIENLTFSGYAGDPIQAQIVRPTTSAPAPAVLQFLDYGEGAGLPGERLHWASCGYVSVIMDSRGQGTRLTAGHTADPHGTGPSVPGFMTRGILDPETFYYRRLYTDALRLVDAVAELPFVDASRIAVTGRGQGGSLALAAAALHRRVAAAMPCAPLLCDAGRSIVITPQPPITEITRFLSVHHGREPEVLRTLAYTDGAELAYRVTIPTYMSTSLMDGVAMPSTAFAAFHNLASQDKSLEVYEHNAHEGGGYRHWLRQVEWLRERFGSD
ncbi:acetylxylan esterase [Bogoriella caseilytica]|nr:acetylxylan esterase [Bogoriella caseilytica]